MAFVPAPVDNGLEAQAISNEMQQWSKDLLVMIARAKAILDRQAALGIVYDGTVLPLGSVPASAKDQNALSTLSNLTTVWFATYKTNLASSAQIGGHP